MPKRELEMGRLLIKEIFTQNNNPAAIQENSWKKRKRDKVVFRAA
jgi:hypothetical protein